MSIMTSSNFSLIETCDTSFAPMIAESPYVNPDHKPALARYFAALDLAGGSMRVEYAKKVYSGNAWGRFYPQGHSRPLTYQRSMIRSLTCSAKQVDIDAKKCHATLLSALGKKHGFSTDCLDEFIQDFDGMVAKLKIKNKQIGKYNEKNKTTATADDIAKFVYTSLLYGAGSDKINEEVGFKINPAHYAEYKKGVGIIAKKVVQLPDYYKIAYDYRTEKGNEKKSDNACLSLICQELESQAVLPIIQRFINEGLTPTAYIYDGFQCLADDRIQGVLDDINKDGPLRFIIKPWKAPLTGKMPFEPFETIEIEGDWEWLDGVTYGVAKHFSETFGADFLYSRLDECWFFWNSMRWVKTEEPIELSNKIAVEFALYLADLADKLDGELETKVKIIVRKIDDIVYRRKIIQECQGILYKEIENWELNPYIFCFDNAVFDIRSGERLTSTIKTDLMTLSTGYNYIEPTESQLSEVRKCIADIFPIEDERVCYLTLLSTGLYGKTLDKFTMGNGCGGNGKNVLNDLMLKAVGNYGTKMSPAVLQNPINIGASPETGVLENKRFVVSREPDENLPFCLSSIKELTGGDTINARMCYSNKTTIANKGTYIVECNTRPQIDGKPDASVTRRLIDALFRTTFVDEVSTDLDEGKFEVLKDTRFTDQSFQLAMRSAVFKIVQSYFRFYLGAKENMDKLIPKAFKQRMLDYVASTDQMFSFLNDRYEITGNPEDILTLRDFHTEFKHSDIFRDLTREQKRGASEKKTIDMISGNVNFRRLYKERWQPGYGPNQVNVRNVLVGVRAKEDIPSSTLVLVETPD